MRQNWYRIFLVAVGAAFVCSAVASDVAFAAPKYSRDSKVSIDVKQTERTKGLEPRKKTTKEKKEEKMPELSSDDFVAIQGKIGHIREAEIEQYKLLIQDTDPKDPELPDLLFRLAERYAQLQRYWRFRAMDMFTKIDKAKGGQKSSLKGKQNNYFKEEKKFLMKSIEVYAQIANNPRFKNYPRMDEALFFYAYTLDSAKRIELSRKVYLKLIKDYPDSKYIPQAYLSFAEYFFEVGNLIKAEEFYDKVLKFPKSPIYAYAMYKKGWVYLNQDRPQDALETFFDVVNITRGKKKQATVNKAAKKDFVRAYAEVGRAEKAYQAFQRVDKSYAFNMLKILGSIYLDQGKAEKSIHTFRELIGLRPKDKLVCEWQGNVLTAMLSVGNMKQKADEVDTLVKVYLKHKKEGIIKGSALQECEDNAQATTGEMAKVWHNEFTKTLDLDTLAHVEALYNLYVESFPKADDIGEMQYYYSELLWTRAEGEKNPRLATERWEKAAIAFTDVVKAGKVNAKQKKEAAYAAVLGWKNALAVDPRTSAPPTEMRDDNDDAPIPEPKPINEREQKMIEAFDIYIDYIKDPNDDELVMMKFLKARIYWRHDHLEDSLPIFKDIVDTHLEHESAEYSINIMLDSYIRLKKYSEMNKFVLDLLKKKSYLEDKEDLTARLLHIKGQTMRKAAEQLETEGRNVECGHAYLDIYNENPDGDNMDEVLYNAGVCFEQGRSIGMAIRSFGTLSSRFPKSHNTQKALVRMGSAYGALASKEYLRKAAEKYEEFASKYSGEKDAPNALQNAVTYRKGIGDDDKAIANIKTFVKKYKNKMKDQAADAMFGLAGIYEKIGREDDIINKGYKAYIKEIGAGGGRDRLLIANARIGQILWEQSCNRKTDDGACVRIERERATRRRKGKRRKGVELPTQCGPESKIKLTVVKRDDRKVREAQKYFKAALAEAKKGAIEKTSDPGRKATATYWLAASQFYLAETDYEEFLSIAFPTKLDFSERNEKKKKDSEKRFNKWVEEKTKKGEKVSSSYEEVRNIKGGGAAWAVAGAARIGQVMQNFSDGLFTATIPNDVRTGQFAEDKVDAYCDQLTTVAGPLEEKSVQAFDFCLNLSTELNWFNKWSRLCEKELGQIRPQSYPTATEVHGEPTLTSPVTDTQGLVSEIKQ